jgi:hypothetical protein
MLSWSGGILRSAGSRQARVGITAPQSQRMASKVS